MCISTFASEEEHHQHHHAYLSCDYLPWDWISVDALLPKPKNVQSVSDHIINITMPT